jgi:hypothetical protein
MLNEGAVCILCDGCRGAWFSPLSYSPFNSSNRRRLLRGLGEVTTHTRSGITDHRLGVARASEGWDSVAEQAPSSHGPLHCGGGAATAGVHLSPWLNQTNKPRQGICCTRESHAQWRPLSGGPPRGLVSLPTRTFVEQRSRAALVCMQWPRTHADSTRRLSACSLTMRRLHIKQLNWQISFPGLGQLAS